MAAEDLTTWTEVDGGADLTVTSAKVDVVAQPNNVDNYVYLSKTVGTADFDYDFECYITSVSGSTPSFFFMGVSTVVDDLGVGFNLCCNIDSTSLTPYVGDVDSGGTFDAFDAGTNFSAATIYYCSWSRVTNTLTWDVYSNSGRTTLVQSMTTTIINTAQSYIYAYAQSSYNFASADDATYYVENVDFKEAAGATGKSNTLMGCLGGSLYGAIG